MVLVKSRKARLEAMHSSRQSDFEGDYEENKIAFEYHEACSSSDSERSLASKHARDVLSSAQWLPSTPEQ